MVSNAAAKIEKFLIEQGFLKNNWKNGRLEGLSQPMHRLHSCDSNYFWINII